MPLRALSVAALLFSLAPSALEAAQVESLQPGHCVSTVRAGLLARGGIATSTPAEMVTVVFCDGKNGRLALIDGKLGVTELTGQGTAARDSALGGLDGKTERLPDGEVTHGRNAARYSFLTGPTRRYGHAILGDAIEASGFLILDDTGKAATFELGAESVFEDLRVRLIDLTGDGAEEFVVIRSYLDGGAALAVYGLKDGEVVPLGETPAIGLSHRWLNPAGAADFDGDGDIEIAYVETPHIGGTLRFVSLTSQGLAEEQAIHGFSNHAIGSRELDMAAVIDWNTDGLPDLAIPDAGRSRLQVVSLAGGKAEVIASLPEGGARHDKRITSAVVVSDLDADGKPELIYTLSDGTLILAEP